MSKQQTLFPAKPLGNLPTSTDTIRALSWKQPYASAMLHGKIETRTWATNYRGWVLICASQKEYDYQSLVNISGNQFKRLKKLIIDNHLQFPPKGQAIAIGKLVDCYKMTPADAKTAFVEYRPELFCHVYEDVTPVLPFEYKGSQKWGKVTEQQREILTPVISY